MLWSVCITFMIWIKTLLLTKIVLVWQKFNLCDSVCHSLSRLHDNSLMLLCTCQPICALIVLSHVPGPQLSRTLCVLVSLTHSITFDVKGVHNAMGKEEITCSVTYFPILKSRRYCECYHCALASSPLSYEHRHTPSQSLSKEHSLCDCYTWFLFSPRLSRSTGFPF